MATQFIRMARMTSQSVDAAKAYQQAERQRVTDLTGLVITDDGATEAIQLNHITVIPCLCAGCLYVAGGSSRDQAFTKLERHLERKHGMQAPREVA